MIKAKCGTGCRADGRTEAKPCHPAREPLR